MVRLKDIAEKAGVSVSTVSQALRDHHSIGEATKERIWKIQKELGYTRHLRERKSPPRSEVARRPKEVAFVLIDRDFSDGQYAALYQAIVSGPGSAGHRYRYVCLKSDDLLKGGIPAALKKSQVDGMIVSGVCTVATYQKMLAMGIPLLVMGNYDLGSCPWNSCEFDYSVLTHVICKRLQSYGHREVHLMLPFPEMRYEIEVAETFRRVAGDYGLSLSMTLELDRQKRLQLVREVLIAKDRPSVMVAASMTGVLEIMEVAQERGVSIPEEINLCTFAFSAAIPYFRNISMWYADERAMAQCLAQRMDQLMENCDQPPMRLLVGMQKWHEGLTLLRAGTAVKTKKNKNS